jgi:hypothetical protein
MFVFLQSADQQQALDTVQQALQQAPYAAIHYQMTQAYEAIAVSLELLVPVTIIRFIVARVKKAQARTMAAR